MCLSLDKQNIFEHGGRIHVSVFSLSYLFDGGL